MTTNPSVTTEPDAKRADQLAAGDHVIEIPGYERNEQPMRVTYAQPYRDGNRRPMVALLLDALDGTEPMYARVSPEREYDLASDGEVAKHRAAAEDLARRAAVVKALHQLAADIVAQALPVPRRLFTAGGVLDSRDELEQWAKHLGVDIRMSGDIPVAGMETGGLTVHFQSAAEPAAEVYEPPVVADPEPAQEWLFTFGSGHQHDGRFVRIQGTYDSARQRMLAVFGNRWCAQYDWQRFDEEGLPARVTELPESEWPPVVDDASAR